MMLENDFDVKEVPEPVRDLTLTKLWIAYSSVTNNFEFVCEGTFVVDDIDVLMSVVIRLEETKQSYKAFFSGRLSIDKLVFDVVFQKENKDNTFIAAYHHEGDGKEPLRDLVAGVSVNLAGYIPPGLVIDLKEVKFIYFKEAEVKRFAFGLQLNVAVDLNQLPVIGEKLPAGMVIRLDDLQVLYTSAAFSAVQVGIGQSFASGGNIEAGCTGTSQRIVDYRRIECLRMDSGDRYGTEREECCTAGCCLCLCRGSECDGSGPFGHHLV